MQWSLGYNNSMESHQLSKLQIQQLLTLTEKVSGYLMSFYNLEYNIDIKSNGTYVTEIDLKVSNILKRELIKIVDFPVLSEESIPEDTMWINWDTYWLIDPIDGTRHFISGSGEFCICIALIHKNNTVFGLIYSPTRNEAWFSQKGDTNIKKFCDNNIIDIYNSPSTSMSVSIGASHLTEKMGRLLSVFPIFDWHKRGSALKYIDIVEGRSNIYPKMWDTNEWDSAAGHCLLECIQGEVVNFMTGEPLRYGYKKSLLNPHFLAYRGLSKLQLDLLLASYQKIYKC